jgi:flagellar protein FliO/FliZ
LGISSILNTFAILFIFCAVLFLSYVASRFLGIKAGKMLKGKNINIVESIALGLDKQLHLVKVGEKFILIATSGKNIQMLTEITPQEMGEISIEKVVHNENFNFKELFEKSMDIFQKKISPLKLSKVNKSSKATNSKLENIRNINNKLKINSIIDGDENSYEKNNGKVDK